VVQIEARFRDSGHGFDARRRMPCSIKSACHPFVHRDVMDEEGYGTWRPKVEEQE
jgi:hypothetical protein